MSSLTASIWADNRCSPAFISADTFSRSGQTIVARLPSSPQTLSLDLGRQSLLAFLHLRRELFEAFIDLLLIDFGFGLKDHNAFIEVFTL